MPSSSSAITNVARFDHRMGCFGPLRGGGGGTAGVATPLAAKPDGWLATGLPQSSDPPGGFSRLPTAIPAASRWGGKGAVTKIALQIRNVNAF